jgi:hypothetical protein
MQSNICPNNSHITLHRRAEGTQWHVSKYSVLSQCEGWDFNSFVPVQSKTTALTTATGCYKTRGTPRDWQIDLLHFPVTTQTALSPAKFCYTFSEIYSLAALYSNTFLPSYNVLYGYKKCLYFMKTLMIWFLRLFHIFITADSYIVVIMQMFYIKNVCCCFWWYFCSQSIKHTVLTAVPFIQW